MSKTIELPPLDFGGHSPEVCECDLIGGDDSCTIQPRYKDAYTQRCDQLLSLLAEREQHMGEIERLKAERKDWQLWPAQLLVEGGPVVRLDAFETVKLRAKKAESELSLLRDELCAKEGQ